MKKNRKTGRFNLTATLVAIIMATIILSMTTTGYASTGADLGVGVPIPALPTTASSSDYGIGMPVNEGLLTHLTVSGFEITLPITWDVSTRSNDGGLFKIITASNKDCEISFIMLSLSNWLAFTKDGVYMVAKDQPIKLISGEEISVKSSSTKTELEILKSAHFNNLQGNK